MIDPQMVELHNEIKALGFPPDETLTPKEARANFAARAWIPGPEVAKVEDVYATSQNFRHTIPMRVYTPKGDGPFPILMWYHGGGWVLGDLDSCTDPIARHLCVETDCIVVTVDYRLAPEFKYPAAVQDAYWAYDWMRKFAEKYNGLPKKIAVGGDSAGGNLAITTCFNAIMDKALIPIAQVLVYPVTQYEVTNSYMEHGEGYILTRERMKWFTGHYLRDHYDAVNPFAAPHYAADKAVELLPPTVTIAAELDPLLDEGYEFHLYMEECGVPCRYYCYEGMQHGFFLWQTKLDKAKEALQEVVRALKEILDES